MKHKVQDQRLDANTTVFLERELTSVDPTKYMELFEGLRAMDFVPPIQGIAPYDRSYEYSMWTITGAAANLGPNARDLPRVGVKRQPFTRSISPIGASYGWTVDDIRAAAAKGVPLEETTVIAAMMSIKRRLDQRIALGDSTLGFTGLINDAQIATDNDVAPEGNFTTAANKLDSLNKLVAQTRLRLKQATEMPGGDGIPAFNKFHILLPTVDYAACKQTPASANYPQSILQVFLDNNSEWVSGVSEWSLLDDADDGTEGRAICYPLNPAALGHATARLYTEEPPQANGLNIDIPCHASSGGTVIRFPVAFSYMRLGA
jgi:hypothetical protein